MFTGIAWKGDSLPLDQNGVKKYLKQYPILDFCHMCYS